MNEVQDIFRIHGEEYRRLHKIPLNQLKAMIAIERCRTSELGGHKRDYPECGYTEISFNSCRNRHCPKCQSINKEKWLEARKGDLLPVGYFHVVFTIPKEFEQIAIRNQKLVYDILLKSASETLRCRNRFFLNTTYLGSESYKSHPCSLYCTFRWSFFRWHYVD